MTRQSEYPERLACRGVMSPDGQAVELRYDASGEERAVQFTVAVEDMVWITLPTIRLAGAAGEAATEAEITQFDHHGLAMVVCRILERQAGYVVVEVPAVAGTRRFNANPQNLARSWSPLSGTQFPHRLRVHTDPGSVGSCFFWLTRDGAAG